MLTAGYGGPGHTILLLIPTMFIAREIIFICSLKITRAIFRWRVECHLIIAGVYSVKVRENYAYLAASDGLRIVNYQRTLELQVCGFLRLG